MNSMENGEIRALPIAERSHACTSDDLGTNFAYRWESNAIQCILEEMKSHPGQIKKFIMNANAVAGHAPGTYNARMNDVGGVEIFYRGNKGAPVVHVPDGKILDVIEPTALVNRLADDLSHKKLDDAVTVIKDEMSRYPEGGFIDLIRDANKEVRRTTDNGDVVHVLWVDGPVTCPDRHAERHLACYQRAYASIAIVDRQTRKTEIVIPVPGQPAEPQGK